MNVQFSHILCLVLKFICGKMYKIKYIKEIEALPPERLVEHLINNGFQELQQFILDKNVNGAQFLNFTELELTKYRLYIKPPLMHRLVSYLEWIKDNPHDFFPISTEPPPLQETIQEPIHIKPTITLPKPPLYHQKPLILNPHKPGLKFSIQSNLPHSSQNIQTRKQIESQDSDDWSDDSSIVEEDHQTIVKQENKDGEKLASRESFIRNKEMLEALKGIRDKANDSSIEELARENDSQKIEEFNEKRSKVGTQLNFAIQPGTHFQPKIVVKKETLNIVPPRPLKEVFPKSTPQEDYEQAPIPDQIHLSIVLAPKQHNFEPEQEVNYELPPIHHETSRLCPRKSSNPIQECDEDGYLLTVDRGKNKNSCQRPLPPVPKARDPNDVKQNIYYKDIGKKEAEAILRGKSIGSFILRPSKRYYTTLMIKASNKILNVPVVQSNGKCYLLNDNTQSNIKFEVINDLIHYYKHNDVVVNLIKVKLNNK